MLFGPIGFEDDEWALLADLTGDLLDIVDIAIEKRVNEANDLNLLKSILLQKKEKFQINKYDDTDISELNEAFGAVVIICNMPLLVEEDMKTMRRIMMDIEINRMELKKLYQISLMEKKDDEDGSK